MNTMKCLCDTNKIYTKYIRKGRAHFVCPECGKDVTLFIVLMYEAMEESKKIREEKKLKKTGI